MSLIGKKIEYKYQYHPKTTEAIVLDKVCTTDKGNYDSDRMEYGQALQVTKYLVKIVNTSTLRDGTVVSITPDMIKRILE